MSTHQTAGAISPSEAVADTLKKFLACRAGKSAGLGLHWRVCHGPHISTMNDGNEMTSRQIESVLRIYQTDSGISQRELAIATSAGSRAVSRRMAALERRGYVERVREKSPSGGINVTIRFTAAGRETVEGLISGLPGVSPKPAFDPSVNAAFSPAFKARTENIEGIARTAEEARQIAKAVPFECRGRYRRSVTLTDGQAECILQLYATWGMSHAALEAATNSDARTVRRRVARLESVGFADTFPSKDGRPAWICVSSKARKAVERKAGLTESM